ncbi:10474_t:CDS:1, partial [Ambispora gerdemannii]
KKIHKRTQTSTSTTKPIIRGAMLTISAILAMSAPTAPSHSNAGFAKDTLSDPASGKVAMSQKKKTKQMAFY